MLRVEAETRDLKGPRILDASGSPLARDNQTIVKERFFLDKTNRNLPHDQITTIDHAYTRPWTVTRDYRRDPHPLWVDTTCGPDNHYVFDQRAVVLHQRRWESDAHQEGPAAARFEKFRTIAQMIKVSPAAWVGRRPLALYQPSDWLTLEGLNETLAMTCPRGGQRDGTMSAEDFEVRRQHMLAEISAGTFHVSGLIGKAALDERVMTAMGTVPRHEFVPIELQPYAYANVPLPIGFDKTISQPFIVALMTDLLDIGVDDVVLEIGTGLGYQAAILAQLARKVYSIEIIEELGQQAKQRLHRQGYTNIELKISNGYHGWSEHAPFDKVIVTAAPDLIPPPLINQLKAGGKMVAPAGLPDAQQLVLVEKHSNGRVTMREILQVRFSQLEDTEPD
jgi:protein-L-isoaspartate(D-aspartate) O-methyltransferase